METHRKPYIREVKATWWLVNRKYKIYMIREATAVMSLLAALELLAFCIVAYVMPEEASRIIASILQNPAVIAFNIIALLAVMFHLVTWFAIMPKAVRMFKPGPSHDTRMIPNSFWIILLSLTTLVASALIAFALIFAS